MLELLKIRKEMLKNDERKIKSSLDAYQFIERINIIHNFVVSAGIKVNDKIIELETSLFDIESRLSAYLYNEMESDNETEVKAYVSKHGNDLLDPHIAAVSDPEFDNPIALEGLRKSLIIQGDEYRLLASILDNPNIKTKDDISKYFYQKNLIAASS